MRKLISLLLAVIIVSTWSAPAAAYNRTNAVNYADNYATSHNSNYVYIFWKGNCTNFVSQCLYAGGVPMDSKWWYQKTNALLRFDDTYSNAWAVANDLKEYVKVDLGALRLVSKWKKVADIANNTYAYVNNSNNLTCENIEVVFYDWGDDGVIDHSSIVVKTGTAADGSGIFGDLIDQNSTDRKQVIWHLDAYNTHRYTTAIYAFRLT